MANWSECEVTIDFSKINNETFKNRFECLLKDLKQYITYSNYEKVEENILMNNEELYDLAQRDTILIDPSAMKKDDSVNERALFSISQLTFYSVQDLETSLSLVLSLSGRWCACSGLFEYLSKTYCPTKMVYVDRENGCDFTHVVIYENGVKKLDKQDAYISLLAFKNVDTDYMIDEIFEELDYDIENEVLKEFTIKEFKQEYKKYYSILKESKSIERLKEWLKENK